MLRRQRKVAGSFDLTLEWGCELEENRNFVRIDQLVTKQARDRSVSQMYSNETATAVDK